LASDEAGLLNRPVEGPLPKREPEAGGLGFEPKRPEEPVEEGLEEKREGF